MKRLLGSIRPLKRAYDFARRIKWRRERDQAFGEYRRNNKILRLQVGGGPNVLAGWFNTDYYPWRASSGLYYLDATRPFPFGDSTFRYVFSEHMIEHLSFEEGLFCIKETHRVLEKGGVVRISCPDLQTLADLYRKPPSHEQVTYIREVVGRYQPARGIYLPGFVVNQLFGFGHKFVYDADTLTSSLQAAGFEGIVRCQPGESGHVSLRGIDAHGADYIAFESLVLEATKPGGREA